MPKPPPDRETMVVILEVPKAMLRQTFGRWLKSAGRYYGCKCKAFWSVDADVHPPLENYKSKPNSSNPEAKD